MVYIFRHLLHYLFIGLVICCTTDFECSLNGFCNLSHCICEPPWSGSTCSVLQELPIEFPQGYGQDPPLISWGGSLLTDAETSNHHLYVTAMTNSCPLAKWQTNSRIEHAVAKSLSEPFKFSNVAVNTWATNPATVALADGRFALFHIGKGDGPQDGGEHCDNSIPTLSDFRHRKGSSIHISASPGGPWHPLLNNSLGNCNNPAPWQHTNSTLYVVCAKENYHVLKAADRIEGPWLDVSDIKINSRNKNIFHEDPFLWVDIRGNWHILFHAYSIEEDRSQCRNSTVSAHMFSKDGHDWHLGLGYPYTTQVRTNKQTITVSTRERPKLLFSTKGIPTHLITAVCSKPSCPEGPQTGCVDCKYQAKDFTLITPLKGNN